MRFEDFTVLLAALAFVWPFLGAVGVCLAPVERSRDVALWMAGLGCALAVAVFVFPATGGVSAGWEDDPVQRAGRVMLALGLWVTVLEHGVFRERLLRSVPHVSTALAGLGCVASQAAIGLGILFLALAWGVFVFMRPAGQALAGWQIGRTGAVGLFLALAGLTLPPHGLTAGLVLACGLVIMTGLTPFCAPAREGQGALLLVPFSGAALLLAMRLRAYGSGGFEMALVAAGLVSVWMTACLPATARTAEDRARVFRGFPVALALMAVGVGADVAALLLLCGWCLAGGSRAGQGWAARALACFPPGAPFVGCLLMLSVLVDWSWELALLAVAGVLLGIARAWPDASAHTMFGAGEQTMGFRDLWPEDRAGRLAFVALAGMGFLVPLAMMLGAF
jgi:hypothetical protein